MDHSIILINLHVVDIRMVNGRIQGHLKIGFFSMIMCCLIIFWIWCINLNIVTEIDELDAETIKCIENELKELKEMIPKVNWYEQPIQYVRRQLLVNHLILSCMGTGNSIKTWLSTRKICLSITSYYNITSYSFKNRKFCYFEMF